ncbi:hypothetical protein [Dyella subtropica]|uniref:hypothetical protein n=1 Tax=Dyella subtropica TaxID=2992127 RepID=UPI00224F982D|nr:hypothetical protein [Dyella subtropica]
MKRLLAGLTLAAVTAVLSGCYYDPGYSYVRSSAYVGDAYYGRGTVVYDDGYYAPGYYGYAPGYYGGYYDCCYAPPVSVGIGGIWYGGSRGHDRDRHWNRGGSWRGRSDGGRRGNWSGGRGHSGNHSGH